MICKSCSTEKPKSEFRKWNRICKKCLAEQALARYYAKGKPERTEKLKEYQRKYQAEYRKKNPERTREYTKRSYENSRKDPERVARTKFWVNLRRASLSNATPKWLSKEQKKQILDFYRNCPDGMQVDHIIPLQGTTVRGFHVPWNLQYLSKSENSSKKNKLIVQDYFFEELSNFGGK